MAKIINLKSSEGLGNATSNDVLEGVTFTSENGIRQVGTKVDINYAAYAAFVSGRTGDELDAMFGKNNEDKVKGIGLALAMYAKFKGETTDFVALPQCDSLADIASNFEAYSEIVNTTIMTFINSNAYAKTYFEGAEFCMAVMNNIAGTQYTDFADFWVDNAALVAFYNAREMIYGSGIFSNEDVIASVKASTALQTASKSSMKDNTTYVTFVDTPALMVSGYGSSSSYTVYFGVNADSGLGANADLYSAAARVGSSKGSETTIMKFVNPVAGGNLNGKASSLTIKYIPITL